MPVHAYNPNVWEAEEVLSSTEAQSKMLVNKSTLPSNPTNKEKRQELSTLHPHPHPHPHLQKGGGEGSAEGSKAIGQETEN